LPIGQAAPAQIYALDEVDSTTLFFTGAEIWRQKSE
jgi:hypothetical protein